MSQFHGQDKFKVIQCTRNTLLWFKYCIVINGDGIKQPKVKKWRSCK